MQPLDLNLADRPFRNNVVLWVGYSVSLALLIAFSVWNVMAYTKYAGLLGELTGEVSSIESQMRDLETRGVRAQNGVEKFDLDALEVQAYKANEVIRWKAFSWTGLFNRLADALPWNVRMSSIRPIFRAGGAITSDEPKGAESVPVAVDGIAKSYEDMLEMQEALFAHPNFGRVEMERFNTALNNEIVFQLRFLYYPEAIPATPATEDAELATVEADPAAEPVEAETANQEIPLGEPEPQPAAAEAEPQSAPKTPTSRRVRRVVDPSEAKDDGGTRVNGKRVKFDIRQVGRPVLLVLLGWLVLCVASYLFLVRPKTAQYSSLVEGSQPQFQVLKQRRAEVEAREGYLDALRQAEQDLVYLRNEVLSSRERRQVLVQAEVARLCRLFSIDLESVAFDNDLLMGEELDRMVMTVPLQGGYENLRKFLQAVESSDKFLVVERVALDENKEGGVMLQLSITLATYFDLPPELKEQKRPTRRRRPRGGA